MQYFASACGELRPQIPYRSLPLGPTGGLLFPGPFTWLFLKFLVPPSVTSVGGTATGSRGGVPLDVRLEPLLSGGTR